MSVITKYCKMCDTIKIREECFYRAGPSWQSNCKPCHNTHNARLKQAKPRVPILNPFQKLPIETQEGLVKYRGTMPNTTLARKFKIKTSTMTTWIYNGYFPT